MIHRKCIALVQMHFTQRKQFSETNVAHTVFNKYQIWRFFLNVSAGHCKRCGGPHEPRGPVVGPHCFSGSCNVNRERHTSICLFTQHIPYIRSFVILACLCWSAISVTCQGQVNIYVWLKLMIQFYIFHSFQSHHETTYSNWSVLSQMTHCTVYRQNVRLSVF